MRSIAKALRARHPRDELHMLLAKRNSGSFTYDGIELGGERVCAEIEDELRVVRTRGGCITKLSIVGYSLGGLVSRYAVGLLYAKGILDTVECLNFATFASPHLGVRSPLKGWHNHMWNVVGAHSLSMSGRQLFTIDRFRDTGRPLLSVLADPASMFMLGQRKFKRHTLYTNIVNDRSAVHYTTGIQKTDPYRRNLDNIKPNCVRGEGVIMDPEYPFLPQPKVVAGASLSSATSTALKWTKRTPLMLVIALLIPIGTFAFLCNSVVQTIRSSGRIRRHEEGQASLKIDDNRVPLLMKELRGEVERAYGAINSAHSQHFLADDEDGDVSPEEKRVLSRERRLSVAAQPTLALTPDQFKMIRSLDSLKWRKYPVWIHNDRHSHAAMIVRMEKKTFGEGWVVLRHFAEEEFLK